MKIRAYEATVTATGQQGEISVGCGGHRHFTQNAAQRCGDRTLRRYPGLVAFAPAVKVERRDR